jgi:multicomponent Na+:H+ antiporter subunit F
MSAGAITAASLIGLGIALLASLVRLVRGPTLPDRIVALDLAGYLAAGIAATSSVTTGEPVLLDAAIALVAITFLGTVAFASVLEKREMDKWSGSQRP